MIVATSSSTNVEGNTEADAAPREASQLVQSTNPDVTHEAENAPGKTSNDGQNDLAADAPGGAGDGQIETTSDQMYQVTIGTKSLLRFLSTNVSNSGTIACKQTTFHLARRLLWPSED